MDTYLSGTQENEGLLSEKLFASWNHSKVNVHFSQARLINLGDEP